MRHSHSYDVLVAGAGPAGSAAALDLSRRGLSVALIEQDRYETRRVGETLPPMIRHQLTGLGIWEQFLKCDPLPSYGIRTAWEGPAPRHQDFVQNPYGCGWHVDRARFDAMLASAAAQAGATLFLPARVTSWKKAADGQWLLEASQDPSTSLRISGRGSDDHPSKPKPGLPGTPTDDHPSKPKPGLPGTPTDAAKTPQDGTILKLSGRMLVDATGRKAMLASRIGGKADVADRLIGAVSFSGNSEIAQWTLVEAVEDGWWYSVPLPGAGMVFAYMTDSDLWMERKWDELLQLAPLTFERAGCRPIPSPSQIVSAASVVRCPVTGRDWMAIGDAALAFDPLSGQGVFKSIETGVRCGSAIARYFDGDLSALAEYETWIKETYQSYLSLRSQFYSSVVRWPESRFWKRRASERMTPEIS